MIEELLKNIDKYLEETGVSKTKFGIDVANDAHLYSRLATSRNTTLKTLEKIRQHIGVSS